MVLWLYLVNFFTWFISVILILLDINSCDEKVPGIHDNGHNEVHIPRSHGGGPKTWTQEDMDMALDALRNHNMSLTKVDIKGIFNKLLSLK